MGTFLRVPLSFISRGGGRRHQSGLSPLEHTSGTMPQTEARELRHAQQWARGQNQVGCEGRLRLSRRSDRFKQ
jgi:hypothetical protein